MKPLALVQTPPDMDRARFSDLIRDHQRPLQAYARGLAGHPDRARDLVQEAFVAAWQTLSRFDVTRDFGCWLRGIVRNNQFAAAVALFGMKLRAMEDVRETAWDKVLTLAQPGLADNPTEERAEFVELVKKLAGKNPHVLPAPADARPAAPAGQDEIDR